MNSPPVWSREIPIKPLVGWLVAHPIEVALTAGIVFRVAGYLANRAYWMDEGSIVGCISNLGQSGLFGPLGSTQLAPPGFLGLEWLAIQLFGTSSFAFRLVPLIAGIAALFLFRRVAHECLSDRSEWVAVLLFAVADDLIYFASEVKQYSSDLALSLMCLVAAIRVDEGPRTAKGAVGLAILGAVVVWFSHPAVFTLAAVGAVGLWLGLSGRDWRRSIAWLAVGFVWVASFAAVHAVAMRQLGYRRDMWAFWDFAFPTLPPRSAWDLIWPIRRLAFLFASPLNFDVPIGPRWSIWPAFALLIVGSIRMLRTEPTRLAWLLLPGGFALVAAYLRLYPFHGRLLLFFAPLLFIPIAMGLGAIRSKSWRFVILVWVVGFPALTATYHLVEPRQRTDPNPYGDRRPSSLNPYWFPLAAPSFRQSRAL